MKKHVQLYSFIIVLKYKRQLPVKYKRKNGAGKQKYEIKQCIEN